MRNHQGRGRPYTPEFRREAIELYRVSGRAVAVVAKDVGVASETLGRWVRQAEIDAGDRQEVLSAESQSEVVALRRRVRRLEQEREILVKAAAFFARESETL